MPPIGQSKLIGDLISYFSQRPRQNLIKQHQRKLVFPSLSTV